MQATEANSKKYGLFLGCNTPALRPDVERAIRVTMPKMGVELLDLPGYVCCPAFGTFPSLDEDAQLAVNAWNLSLAEEQGVDLCVECGSCYSSLRTGRDLLCRHKEKVTRVNELLGEAGRSYAGTSEPRHITDILYREIGPDRISSCLQRRLEGLKVVVQYPCHTLFPAGIVGFERSATRPTIMAELVEALGGEVQHFSREYQCCGGAGGFHGSSKAEAAAFTRRKLDAIRQETRADMIVVSCITCLMYLDHIQKELNDADATTGKGNGNGDGNGSGAGGYGLPVFDYNQLLALCMGHPAEEVARIATVPRERITGRFK